MEHNIFCESPSAEAQLSKDICLLYIGNERPTTRHYELVLVAVTSLHSACLTLFG